MNKVVAIEYDCEKLNIIIENLPKMYRKLEVF